MILRLAVFFLFWDPGGVVAYFIVYGFFQTDSALHLTNDEFFLFYFQRPLL